MEVILYGDYYTNDYGIDAEGNPEIEQVLGV